jgi:hypothetical protein
MDRKLLFAAVPATLLVLGNGAANAGQTINEAGTVACATDKWDESEPEKGHKLVEYAGRCICIDNDPTAPSRPHDCVGKYEYMPDGSWKGGGTCISNSKMETSYTNPLRRVRTSRNTSTSGPVAPANMKARVAAARTCTRV